MPTDLNEHPARGKSLTHRLVDALSGQIRQGGLRPGDRVPSEPELVREYGVSRTVVREAMQRLQAAGLVQTQHGVGTFVLAAKPPPPLLTVDDKQLNLRDVMAMLELRICVESEAAALAALRRDDAHVTKMKTALESFEAHLHEGVSTAEDDFRFHLQIASATGNSFFEQVLTNLGGATISRPRIEAEAQAEAHAEAASGSADGERFKLAVPPMARSKEHALQEHAAIFEGIRRGDPAAARAAMFMHLNNSRERLRRAGGSEA